MTDKVEANCTHFEMDTLRLCLFVLELLLNVGVIFLSALLAILLSRTNTLDRNPKVLLANHQLASFLIALTRFVLIPQMLTATGFLSASTVAPIQWIHDVAINVNTFIQLAITIECLLSTFWPLAYEGCTAQQWMAIATLIWPWICTATLYSLEQMGFIQTIPMFLAMEGLNLACWVVFCLLHVVNRRKYRQISAGDLAGKYKVIVNIKTVRTLNFVSALSAIRNFITMSLLLLIILYFKPMCDYYAYLISSHSYDLSISFYNFLLIIPLVLTHDEFAKHFRSFFRSKRAALKQLGSSGAGGKARTTVAARNALGENIMVSHNPSQYFQQLAKSWEANVPTSNNNNNKTAASSPGIRSVAPFWPPSGNNSRRHSRRIVEVEIPGSQ